MTDIEKDDFALLVSLINDPYAPINAEFHDDIHQKALKILTQKYGKDIALTKMEKLIAQLTKYIDEGIKQETE